MGRDDYALFIGQSHDLPIRFICAFVHGMHRYRE
jgi:hypothetical protein